MASWTSGPSQVDFWAFPGGSVVKSPPANAGDVGSIPGSGRSPGGGHGSLLQYSCLENPMDTGAQWATVHGVSKSWVQLKWHSWNSLIVLRLILAKRLKSNSSHNCGFFFFPLPCWSVFTSCIWELYCFVHTCIKLYVLKMSWQFYHYSISLYSFILGKCLCSEVNVVWY